MASTRLTLKYFEYDQAGSSWVWTSNSVLLNIQPKFLSFGYADENVPPPNLGFWGYIFSIPVNLEEAPLYTVEAPTQEEVVQHLGKYLEEHLPEELPPIPRSAWERIPEDFLA